MKLAKLICAILFSAIATFGQYTVPQHTGATGGGGIPTFVQFAYAEWVGVGGTAINLTSSNTNKAAFASSLGANNVVVVFVNNSATTTAQSVTFSPSLTVTGLTGNPFSGNATSSAWTAPTGAGGANTNVSAAWTTTSPYDSMPLAEYSGVNLTTPVDTGGSASCSSTTLTGAGPFAVGCNVTTTGTNEMIVTLCVLNVAGTAMQAGTGETIRVGNSVSASVTNGTLMEEMFAPTPGTYATGCKTASGATSGGVLSLALNHS